MLFEARGEGSEDEISNELVVVVETTVTINATQMRRKKRTCKDMQGSDTANGAVT